MSTSYRYYVRINKEVLTNECFQCIESKRLCLNSTVGNREIILEKKTKIAKNKYWKLLSLLVKLKLKVLNIFKVLISTTIKPA